MQPAPTFVGSPMDASLRFVAVFQALTPARLWVCFPGSPSVCAPCSSKSWHGLECPEQLSTWPPSPSILQTPAEGPRPQCGPSVIQPQLTHPSLCSSRTHLPLSPTTHHAPTILSGCCCPPTQASELPQLPLPVNPFISSRPPLISSFIVAISSITPLRIGKKSVYSHVHREVKLPTYLKNESHQWEDNYKWIILLALKPLILSARF